MSKIEREREREDGRLCFSKLFIIHSIFGKILILPTLGFCSDYIVHMIPAADTVAVSTAEAE